MTRYGLELTDQAEHALESAAEMTDRPRHDAVVRAILIYEELLQCAGHPGRCLDVDLFGDGDRYRIQLRRA